MSVTDSRLVRGPHKVGDWVTSNPVGSKGPFNGQIVGERRDEFIVKDGFGKRWARMACELSPIVPEREAER